MFQLPDHHLVSGARAVSPYKIGYIVVVSTTNSTVCTIQVCAYPRHDYPPLPRTQPRPSQQHNSYLGRRLRASRIEPNPVPSRIPSTFFPSQLTHTYTHMSLFLHSSQPHLLGPKSTLSSPSPYVSQNHNHLGTQANHQQASSWRRFSFLNVCVVAMASSALHQARNSGCWA